MRWRVYYDDGTTYEGSTVDEAMDAPTTGAVIVKHEADCRTGYALRKGAFFFCFERIRLSDGTYTEVWRWAGKNDLFGLMDYYTYHKGPQKVLIGREIHDETYKEISRKAESDGCFCTSPCEHH